MADNSQQIAEWNGPLGERWAREQAEFDKLTGPFGDAAMKAAAPQPGERVLDIGCGCGDSAITLAERVGPKGDILGVDISHPMLEVARHRGQHLDQLSLAEADASVAPLPGGRDLLYSRFGVMFFADPVGAFAHMRKALKPGGRVAFVCWRTAKENPWASVPVAAARAGLKLETPPADPHAPGPFAFGDGERVKRILTDAGFVEAATAPFDHQMYLGKDQRSAAEAAVRTGPLGRLARDLGPERIPEIVEAVAPALAPYAGVNGVVLPAAAWIVTARA